MRLTSINKPSYHIYLIKIWFGNRVYDLMMEKKNGDQTEKNTVGNNCIFLRNKILQKVLLEK